MALTLLRELRALGVEILGLDWRANPLAEKAGIELAILPPRGPFARTALWHLDLLRRVGPLRHDLLLDPSGYPDALGHHPSLVLLVHDLSALGHGVYPFAKHAWFRLWLGRSLRRARLVVCVSEHTRSEVRRRFRLDPDRCVVVPNSLDPELTAKATAARPRSRPFFLAVGTIERRKNSLRLVEAFAAARARGVREDLVLAGRPGHGSDAVFARIGRADLEGAVEVRGPVDDATLRGLYQQAEALLFPSLEEGFGLPILEAMAAGTPVLTSNVTAMPEVAGEAALLVDPSSERAITDGIVQLAHDPELRRRLVALGKERVKVFEPRRTARAWLHHLEAL